MIAGNCFKIIQEWKVGEDIHETRLASIRVWKLHGGYIGTHLLF